MPQAAVFWGAGRPLTIEDLPLVDPEPGAVIVRITRANICGSDLHFWRGTGNPRLLPRVLGHEMTGVVATLGDGVTTDSVGAPLRWGDRIVYRYFYPCGRCTNCIRGVDAACPNAYPHLQRTCQQSPYFNGAFAEYYYLRPGHTVFRVPDDVPEDLVSPINCALSQVIYGFDRVNFHMGETVVVQGAGGLGLYATAVARESGAATVIVIDQVGPRLNLALEFGADHVLSMADLRTSEERIRRVKELTAGCGADVVVDVAGAMDAIPEGLQMLGNGGRYLEIGNISRGHTITVSPADFVYGSKALFGITLYPANALQRALAFVVHARHRYPLQKIVSHRYPLSEINRAFEEQNTGTVIRATLVPRSH